MHVVHARNVNDAYEKGLQHLYSVGEHEDTRAGKALVAPWPVTTVYERPLERVLLDPRRDANPFFHLFEALWMLRGRRDGKFLDRFVRDFSSRFGEPGTESGLVWGAYGHRWRYAFGGDQIEKVVAQLRANPSDRRVVVAMWSPELDLLTGNFDFLSPGKVPRDVPCNTHAYPRVRRGLDAATQSEVAELDLTVCCRSNDAVWGAYGANAVHFSFLLEYLAGRVGARPGRLYQLSNNFHAYDSVLAKVGSPAPATGSRNPYAAAAEGDDVALLGAPTPLGVDWSAFHRDLRRFMNWCDETAEDPTAPAPPEYPGNPWLHSTAQPLWVAHWLWRQGLREAALEIVEDVDVHRDMSPDWRTACAAWMRRRLA